MILNIRVIPKAGPVRNPIIPVNNVSNGASKNLIKEENNYLKAYLTKPPQNGLANKELIGLLAEYLGVRKYQIKIIKGEKSKNKTVKIDV